MYFDFKHHQTGLAGREYIYITGRWKRIFVIGFHLEKKGTLPTVMGYIVHMNYVHFLSKLKNHAT